MNYKTSDNARLILGHQSPALKEALWQAVNEAKEQNGPLAPVTIVGPSLYANLSLRHELGRKGFANVSFILFPALAELLGAATMAKAGKRPLMPVIEQVSVRAALDQAGEPLAQVKEHRATQSSLRHCFQQLRQVSEEVLQKLEESGSAQREVVRLYREFRANTADGWYDAEDMARVAAEAVNAGDTSALRDRGLIVFYLPYGLTPGQKELVRALAANASCVVLLGLTGDQEAEADGPIYQLNEELQSVFGQCQRLDDKPSESPSSLPETALHVAPDAHSELRQVIRGIMASAEKGVPLHQMAVLYRMDQPYASLVRDELNLAEVPMAGPGRRALAETAVGRTLTGMLQLSASLNTEDALRRDEVMGWLTGCPIRQSRNIDREHFIPSRWDAISRKAGVVRGINQWKQQLTGYASQKDKEINGRDEEVPETRVKRLQADAQAALAALRFIEELADDLQPPRAGAQWSEFTQWAQNLLNKYLRRRLTENREGDQQQSEDAAKQKIDRLLQDLSAADTLPATASLTSFRQVVEDYLQLPEGHIGETGKGVFVAPFSSAAGMSFNAVWMVGMIEGSVPPPVNNDPLLPGEIWQAAGDPHRLSRQTAQERYEYLAALATAPRHAFSFPVANPAQQRKAFPAPWFLERASALAGEAATSENLLQLDLLQCTATPSLESSLLELTVPADIHDYDLHWLLHWRREHGRDNGRSPHPLAKEGLLAKVAQMSHSRNGYSLTEFDGNLSSVAGEANFSLSLTGNSISPTSLETWAACPFRYFLSRVLHLSALEDPEEETGISKLNRGNLMHEILEEFLKDANKTKTLPDPGQPWSSESAHRLREIARGVFEKYESSGITGKPLLWQIERQNILSDLDIFLGKDAELRARYGSAVSIPEPSFGGKGEGWQAAVDEATGISFRGWIDRVDLDSSGSPALIVDYKTGKSGSYTKSLNTDPIDKGKRLQLGAYSLAAKQQFPQAQTVPAIYWFVTGEGEFKTEPSEPFDINRPETLTRFREGITAITAGIRSGVFPANPGGERSGLNPKGPGENCNHCDFNTLCPRRQFRIWGRKKEDALVSGYLTLTGEGSGNADEKESAEA